ncbi:MAG TPA: hypothetical protein VFY10_08985 [Dehalococcoidia bacterium]|nr:hypothetical protein [Dehalococcoidia bacterium]
MCSGRGRLIWGNGETAHYESELSELLDEPAPPASLSIGKAALELVPPLLALAAILCVLAILKAQDYFFVPGDSISVATKIAIGWFGIVIPCVFAYRYMHDRTTLRRQLPLWREARRRWTSLYYCPKDDVVFARDSYDYVAPADLDSLLYPRSLPAERHPLQNLPERFLGRGQA